MPATSPTRATDSGFDTGQPGNVVAGHRKVAFYGTTAPFGGSGDLLGCDASTTSGVTHGHTVAAVALGNATKVAVSYGTAWRGVDGSGNFWGLDGVAPKARLIAYDGQITPLSGRCDDVTQIDPVNPTALNVGNLFTVAGHRLALPDGYAKGARTINFSWGSVANTFDINAGKIDAFLNAQARRRDLRRRRQRRTRQEHGSHSRPEHDRRTGDREEHHLRRRVPGRGRSRKPGPSGHALGQFEQRPRDHHQPADRAARDGSGNRCRHARTRVRVPLPVERQRPGDHAGRMRRDHGTGLDELRFRRRRRGGHARSRLLRAWASIPTGPTRTPATRPTRSPRSPAR